MYENAYEIGKRKYTKKYEIGKRKHIENI